MLSPHFTLYPLPLETLLPFPRGKGLWRVQNFVPLPLPLHTLGPYPQGFVNPWHSLMVMDGEVASGGKNRVKQGRDCGVGLGVIPTVGFGLFFCSSRRIF